MQENGRWRITVYAHNTARTRKHVNAGATITSPATGFVLNLTASEHKVADNVWEDWELTGTSNELYDLVWRDLYWDPNLSFDLWMSASRL